MKKLTTSLAAVLASVALLHTAATAQSASTGDLILGFQTASPNTGSSDNLEVNLGLDTAFTTITTINLSSDLTLGDITGTYGSGATALYFGVVGTLGSGGGGDTIFLSTAVGQEPKVATSESELATAEGKINSLYSPYSSGTPGAGSNDAVLSGAGASGTYTYAAGSNGTVGNYDANGIQALYSSSGSETLDLWKLANGSNTLLGTLTLTANEGLGTESLTFTGADATAVPEPKAYMMMGIGCLVFFFMMRRRMKQI